MPKVVLEESVSFIDIVVAAEDLLHLRRVLRDHFHPSLQLFLLVLDSIKLLEH